MITKKEFELYEDVRASGVTNMFNIKVVEKLTGLPKETILKIMDNYGELERKYYDEKYTSENEG